MNFVMDDMFYDDDSMDLFLGALGGQTDESGLNAYDSKTNKYF